MTSRSATLSVRHAERGRRTHLLVFAFGVASIVMLLVVDRFRSRVVAEDTLLEAYVAEVKTQITLAHLWVEERVSGDDVDVEEIDAGLAAAVDRVVKMLGEGASDGVSLEARLKNPDLQRLGRQLLAQLVDFRAFASLRRRSYDQGLPVGIGSFADKAFDKDFEETFDSAERLREEIAQRRLIDERESRLILQLVLGGWTLIVIAATLALRSRELQRRAAQAALSASQEQLFQSQKMEAVGRLAGGLAHDINNYLAAIRGHCELVRMTNPVGEKLTRRMDGAIQVVDKASTLLTRLLSISHRQPLALAVVDLNELVLDLERIFTPTLGPSIVLETRLTPDPWLVESDPSQLEQVLSNLVVNAKDAMPHGGRVRLSTFNRPATTTGTPEEVWLEVEDTGEGIPPEILSRIFEPFLTTKAGKSHAGLGLSVVYGIVRQSNGRVEVHSEKGKGTRFRIRLPRTDKKGPATGHRRPGTAPSGSEPLILVDGNQEFRESTADWLRALGYRVTTAADGQEALALLRQEPTQLLIADVTATDFDGVALVRRLSEVAPGLRVLWLSAHDLEDLSGQDFGAHKVLLKQQIGMLAWKIRGVLDAR